MWSLLWGLVGGFVAWLATAILGQPIYTFLSLRSEAARLVSLYERPRELPAVFTPTRAISEEAWQTDRRRAYQNCGSHLMGISAANGTMELVPTSPMIQLANPVGLYRFYAHRLVKKRAN